MLLFIILIYYYNLSLSILGWMMNQLTILVGPFKRKQYYTQCGVFKREADTGETIYIPCVRKATGRGVVVKTVEKTLILCEVAIYGKQG